MQIQVPNPNVPIHFERYGTAPVEPNKYFNAHQLLQSEYYSVQLVGNPTATEQVLLSGFSEKKI